MYEKMVDYTIVGVWLYKTIEMFALVKESILSINEKALVATPSSPLTTHLTSMSIILIFPYFLMPCVRPYWLLNTI